MKKYWELFLAFARVGVMTFGGGYAMIPILEREIIDKHHWATSEELMDYYAVGQCTPGVISVNTATFIGYKYAGVSGGIIATLGVVFPSLVIITVIAGILTSFADVPAVKSAFAGIRVCVCVLIFNAVVKLWKKAVVDKATLAIFLAVFLLSVFLDVSPVVFVVLSAAAGIALTRMGGAREMILLRLFFEFFKTGLFAVGGGMATLPFMYDIADRTGWFTHEMLADMIAVSESTPGPIGVNMATYVGYATAGIPGSVIATLGLITPSVMIILLIARALKAFRDNPTVDAGFYGLRPCSVGLIAAAGVLVVRLALLDTARYAATGVLTDLFNCNALLLAAVLFVCTRYVKKLKGLHPIVFILGSAVVGIAFSF